MPQHPLLGVNIDHIATLRQNRGTIYPDPIEAAKIAEKAGADGITVHLREDRRHIQDQDVITLAKTIKTRLNLEMAPTEEMLTIAEKIKPTYCCLVPEKRQELTTEGGLDIINQQEKITTACQRLAEAGIQVSLFIEPNKKTLDIAKACSAPIVELHTGTYSDTTAPEQQTYELNRIKEATAYGNQIGLQINAGHGLNYQNIQPIAAIPNIIELNIGHSIIAQSIFIGLEQAIKEIKKLIQTAKK